MESLRLEWVYPETLTPNPLNWRLHPEGQRREFDALFSEVGWAGALLFNEATGNLIDGHLRREQLAGKGEPVPVLIGNWTPAQEKLILARLDPISALAETSKETLNDLLHQIETDDPVIQQALSDMAAEADLYFDSLGDGDDDIFEDEPPIDKAEELQDKWGVRPGDLWQLGEHRVVCGDCTDAEAVARLMNGEKADLMVTDPPYGVERDKGFGGFDGFRGDKSKPAIKRRSYSDEWDSERPEQSTFELLAKNAKVVIIWGGNFFADILPRSTHWIVWDKENTMPTFGDCELAWTNIDRKSVKKYTVTYNGLIGKETDRFHPTQKPVKLMSLILQDYSQESHLIIDPFLGSGTTLIACEQLGRRCRGIEIEPKYCAVILERWHTLTGQTPVRA